MSPAERSALLRARHRALFPHLICLPSVVAKKPKPQDPPKRGVKTSDRFGVLLCFRPKEWVLTREERIAAAKTVPRWKRPHELNPLTRISEQLKRPEKEREKVMLTPDMV